MRVLKRTMRSDDAGVASTVGTTMALLVFLTFMSLIVGQYVPAWMRESEASHSNTVIGQFGALKGAIDLQILAANSALSAGKTYVPITSSTAVALGVDGIPIFAGPTPATMALFPTAGAFTVTFDYNIRAVLTRVAAVSSGSVELDIQNRYVNPQRVVYENGAVIRHQQDGQVIRAAPIFTVRKVSAGLEITFALVSLYGTGVVSGTATEVVNSQLFAFDDQRYQDFPANARIWINHTSRYGLAWYRFMNDTLADALRLPGMFSQSQVGVRFSTTAYTISATLIGGTELYSMKLEIRNNPGVLGFNLFRLQLAQVQIRVGETTQSA